MYENRDPDTAANRQLWWNTSVLCLADGAGGDGASGYGAGQKVDWRRKQACPQEVREFGKMYRKKIRVRAEGHCLDGTLGGGLSYIHRRSKTVERGLNEIRRFVRENIHLTKPLRSSGALAKWVKYCGYDCIVVGSDQVWREIYSPDIEDFFLGFLPEDDKRLKITYAASFGTADSPISEAHLENCVRLAKRFDALSVRERSGVEILKDTFGLEARLVLDPTLLLTAEQYRFPVENTMAGGIVSYILDETDDKDSIIGQVAQSLGLNETKVRISSRSANAGTLLKPSVEEWLAAFATADFVVTDSFHGCVFSIINHKPFIAIANKDRGLERFTSLLGSFGLMDRLVFDHEEFEKKKSQILQPIDYEPVNSKRQELIQGSLEFLAGMISQRK